MNKINKEIAKHLNDLGYLFSQNKDSWRSSAYLKAAESISTYPKELTILNDSIKNKIPGIGKGIESVIIEFVSKGTSDTYVSLMSLGLPPPSIQELQRIPKVGLVTAKKLWEQFGIKSLKDFEDNLDKIGQSEFKKYIVGYEQVKNAKERLPATQVKPIVDNILDPLKLLGYDIGYAGSLRRGKETIKDIDIIVCLNEDTSEQDKVVLRNYFNEQSLVPDVRDGNSKWGLNLLISDDDFITMDLNFCHPKSRGAYYNYLTGSKEFNIECRSRFKALGFLLNQDGIFDQNGLQIDNGKEEHLFELLGVPYVPPHCRAAGALGRDFSNLITKEDLIGDLHCHSTNSDGGGSWDQILEAAAKEGYQYFGITDHSIGSGNGPKKDQKLDLIIEWNNKEKPNNIICLYGSEIDVKVDGSLAYDQEVIEKLDYFLIAAHHSPDKNITERYLQAMNAYPTKPKIIAHPTNRKISTGFQSEADWNKVFDVCKKTNTILEINGQPDRQDLPPEIIRGAIEAGVYLCINSDSHGINFRRLQDVAIKVAQRGWVTSKHVVNARTELNTIERWLNNTLYSN